MIDVSDPLHTVETFDNGFIAHVRKCDGSEHLYTSILLVQHKFQKSWQLKLAYRYRVS